MSTEDIQTTGGVLHPQDIEFINNCICEVFSCEEKKLFETVEEHHTTVFMAELGIPLYFSKGSHTNIKITTKEDIDLFLGYQLAKKYKEEHPEQ